MSRKLLLQCKFLLVEFLNITANFIPLTFRHYYFRLFGFIIGNNSTIHRKCIFFHIGNLKIGNNSTINWGCYLDNRRGIFIGNNVGIAHNTKIYTLGHDIDDAYFSTKGASVVIEDNVFIFSNSIICPGVKIGEGAIILPGSIIIKDVEPYSIVGGNPSHFIRYRNKDIRYTQSYKYWFAL